MLKTNPLEPYSPHLLAALRVTAGLIFLSHGLIKVIGYPAGAAPGQQELLTLFGVGGVIEIVTGALIALGLFTRPAAFVASGQMAVAYWMFHAPGGFHPVVNQGEAAALYAFVFLYLAAAGPGAFSLGRLLRRSAEPAPQPRLA